MQNALTDFTDSDLYYTDQKIFHFTGHSHNIKKKQVKMFGILIFATGWRFITVLFT